MSVVMPAFNHESYIRQAIESVARQKLPFQELIIVDDGSVDKTFETARDAIANLPLKCQLHRQTNQGVSKALNTAISLAQGEWIAVLASDDYYDSGFLSTYVSTIREGSSELGLVHCDAFEVDENGAVGERIYNISQRPPAEGAAFEDLVRVRSRVIASTAMFRRDLWETVGGFDEKLLQEDFDFHLRLARIATFSFVNQPLFYSRRISGSLGRSPSRWVHNYEIAIRKHSDYLGESLNEVLQLSHIVSTSVCLNGNWTGGGLRYATKAVCASKCYKQMFFSSSIVICQFIYYFSRRFVTAVTKKSPASRNFARAVARGIRGLFIDSQKTTQ